MKPTTYVLAAALAVVASSCSPAVRPDLPEPEYEAPRGKPTAAEPDAQAEPTGAPTGSPDAPPVKVCTKIGCMSALTVTFDGAANKKGKYTIKLESAEGTGTCEITLPFKSCEKGLAKCEGTMPITIDESQDPCKIPAKDQSLLPVKIGVAPDTVEVTVTRDKKEAAKATITPTYETNQPNGPGCEPTCKVGSAAVTVK